MKVKQGNVYEKLGRLIAEYSTILERTDEKDLIDGKYLELTADEFKEVAKRFGIFCPQDYEMKETTVRLYRYLDDVLMLKIPDKDIINKMAEPSAWPLPGFFDKAYNCDRDVHVAGVDKLPRTPSEAEASLDKIKKMAYAQSKPLTDTAEISKWRKDLRIQLVHEQLGWYSITNCG